MLCAVGRSVAERGLATELCELGCRAEPPSPDGARVGAGNRPDPVTVVGVNTKDDGVARDRVCDFGQNVFRVGFSDLQKTAVKRLTTEVDAQGDLTVLPDIAVPGVVVAGRRGKAIDAPFEAADVTARGEIGNRGVQLAVVAHQFERASEDTRVSTQLYADAVMGSLVVLRAVNGIEQLGEQARLDEAGQLQVALATELGPRTSDVFRRAQAFRPSMGDTDHKLSRWYRNSAWNHHTLNANSDAASWRCATHG